MFYMRYLTSVLFLFLGILPLVSFGQEVHTSCYRRTIVSSNHDSEESEGVCGGRCTLGHAMELGHSNYYQRVYLEHFEPKSISFESISQLYF